jgi:hypothetical protein
MGGGGHLAFPKASRTFCDPWPVVLVCVCRGLSPHALLSQMVCGSLALFRMPYLLLIRGPRLGERLDKLFV